MEKMKEIKQAIDDLNLQKMKLGTQFKEFQMLQNEIAELAKRAPNDPVAAEKLKKLDKVLTPEKKQQVQGMAQKLGERFSIMYKQMENLMPKQKAKAKTADADIPAAQPKKPKQIKRYF